MKKETKKELIEWGLAIGMVGAMSSITKAAERKNHADMLKKLGPEEYKKWAQKYKKETDKVATMVVNVLKVIAIVGFLAAIIETLMK